MLGGAQEFFLAAKRRLKALDTAMEIQSGAEAKRRS
jgi:hypothetical protein